tara:strand:+ start:119 stop:352 length:234 start_codon:yes stop_codon:yes gene_type:complete
MAKPKNRTPTTVRALVKWLKANGYKVEGCKRNANRLKITLFDEPLMKLHYYTPARHKDPRGLKNAIADLRRKGIPIP